MQKINMQKEDKVLTFLQKTSPRIGPVNAMNMLKDAQLAAFRQLFTELGLTESHIDEIFESHLTKMAQNIMNMPVPSPIQRT